MEKGCNCNSYCCDCYKVNPGMKIEKEGYLISLLITARDTENKEHAKNCIESAIRELRSRV